MRARTSFSLFLVAALTAPACRDATGPDESLLLSLAILETRGPVILDMGAGEHRLECEAKLGISAVGEGSATWEGGVLRFYYGPERVQTSDTLVLTAAELQDSWPHSRLRGGVEESWWWFNAGAPFDVELHLRYRVNDRRARSVTRRIPCGPSDLSSAPPPMITRFEVVPPAGPLEPGGSLEVLIEASSTVGFWESRLVMIGPCEVRRDFNEGLVTSIARTVRLDIPQGCQLGVPITIGLGVRDAALRATARMLQTSHRLVDVTPPYVNFVFYEPWGRMGSFEMKGTFFVGEPIEIDALASDAGGVASVGWEVLPSGHSGTFPVAGSEVHQRLHGLGARPEWIGDIQLRITATDIAGHLSRTALSAPGALRVLPTTVVPEASVTVAGEIREFAIDEPRQLVYLLQSNERRLAVLSMTSMAVTTVALPSYPTSLALSASGDSLLMTMPLLGALAVVDLQDPSLAAAIRPLASLDASLEQRPQRVRVTSNGKAFVALEGNVPAAWTLLEVDLATGAERIRRDAGADGHVGGGKLEVSLDRSVMAINGGPQLFQRYDAATDLFGERTSVIPYDWSPMLDATGRWTLIGLQLFDEMLTPVRRVESRIPVGANATPISVLSADGEHVVHALWSVGLIRSRTSDGAMIDRIPVPFGPTALSASASGRWLVVVRSSYGETSEIAVLDMR